MMTTNITIIWAILVNSLALPMDVKDQDLMHEDKVTIASCSTLYEQSCCHPMQQSFV